MIGSIAAGNRAPVVGTGAGGNMRAVGQRPIPPIPPNVGAVTMRGVKPKLGATIGAVGVIVGVGANVGVGVTGKVGGTSMAAGNAAPIVGTVGAKASISAAVGHVIPPANVGAVNIGVVGAIVGVNVGVNVGTVGAAANISAVGQNEGTPGASVGTGATMIGGAIVVGRMTALLWDATNVIKAIMIKLTKRNLVHFID